MSSASKIPTSFIISLLIVLLLAKMIAVALFWFLPLEGVELKKHYSFVPEYLHVDLAKAFGMKRSATVTKISTSSKQIQAVSINSMILKGLYGNDKKGFAIVAKKRSPNKTTIVGIGESFEGYTLKSIALESVIFTKGGKEFVLKLQKSKKLSSQTYHVKKTSSFEDGTIHRVDNSDVNYFAKNPREIWKNISIQERRRGGKIEGFEVRWIKPGSKFAALGLKKGDLIIKANNKRLQSYKDAIDIYKKIDKLDEISIVVLRNNQEKEIVYEINR